MTRNPPLFITSIKYEKMQNDGTMKNVTEQFIVEAVNYTDAEKRIIEERTPYMTGEYEVSDIKRAAYKEIFKSRVQDADKWYKAKLTFITLDERKGIEKKTTSNVLVQAEDFGAAVEGVIDGMQGTIVDYTITAIAETPILEVYDGNED